MAQFVELEAFAKFIFDIDKATQEQLTRGQRLCELLKQSQSTYFMVVEHISTIYIEKNGYLDSIKIGQIKKFLVKLLKNE